MKKQPKIIFLISLAISFILVISGCGSTDNASVEGSKDEEKMVVYTTLFPMHDFAKQIGGEHVVVKSLVPAGTEAHDFEPSPKNMTELNEAQLFLYNGAGYETWIDKVSENLDPTKTKSVELSQGLALLEADKMEEESHEGEASHEEEESHGHEGELPGTDPHVWLDPTLAKQQANLILQAFAESDPEHAETYQKNYDSLATELDALDQEMMSALSAASQKEFITAHRAFAYLANRYDLVQIGVSGLSPSEEPSQKDLRELIDIVKEREIKYVAFEEMVESKVAKTVQLEAGVEAIILNPLENVTKEQAEAGVTYVELMKENLESLKKMLGAP